MNDDSISIRRQGPKRKCRMLEIIALFCFFSLMELPPLAWGGSYYVTQLGAGSQNGALGNEWSVANFNASSTATGGDTVYFSGTITSTVKANKSGTGDGSGRLTLEFTSATIDASTVVNINGKSYLNIFGGTIASSRTSGSFVVFGTGPSSYVTIARWTFEPTSNANANFVTLDCYNNCTNTNNVLVENNVFKGGQAGYMDSVNNITYRNNVFWTGTTNAGQVDIISSNAAQDIIIEGNLMKMRETISNSEAHDDCIQTWDSRSGQDLARWTVRYNWIELDTNQQSNKSWMMIEGWGSSWMKVYSNVFLGTHGAQGANGINPNGNSSSFAFYMYGNTFIRKDGPNNTLRFQSPGTLYSVNNVGQADSDESGTFLDWGFSQGGAWDYNFFYGFDGCSATHAGAHGSCSTNPSFVDSANNNFALSPSSPLKGVGATLAAEYGYGIAPGATWPNPKLIQRYIWDPGAFVAVSGGPAAPQMVRGVVSP